MHLKIIKYSSEITVFQAKMEFENEFYLIASPMLYYDGNNSAVDIFPIIYPFFHKFSLCSGPNIL